MDEMIAEKQTRIPTHPGELLSMEVLPSLNISISEFARHLRVSRQTIHGILSERKSISLEMALRIGKYLGNGPQLWIRMQQAYDLAVTECRIREELNTISQINQTF